MAPTPPAKQRSSAPPPADNTDTSAGMDYVKQQLGNITNLPDDALNELKDRILELFDQLGGGAETGAPPDADKSGALAVLASASQLLKNEILRRDRYSKNTSALAEFSNVSRGGGTGNGNGSGALTIKDVPAAHRPQPRRSVGGGARAVTASGSQLHNASELASEFMSVIKQNRVPNAPDGRYIVASVKSGREPGSFLPQDDPATVTAAVDAAAEMHVETFTAALQKVAKGEPMSEALVAAGGLGAPEQTDYVLPGFAAQDRPVKGALPGFSTDRGGVRFTRPPLISDVNGAIGLWTVADDIEAATNPAKRKPTYRVNVGGEVVVDVQAITNSLIWGNMLAGAYPEFVTAATDVVLAMHSRIAEQQLLTQIGGLSTNVTVAANTDLGATRVLLPTLEVAAESLRDRLRMPDSAPLQVILPRWTRGILRADLTLQQPGDAVVGVTNAEVDAYLAASGLAVTYALDGEAGQHFNPQAAGTLQKWPTTMIAYMFPAGAFQLLDGGELNVGLVRDTATNAANDFQMFSETFEAAMFRGGLSLRISQPITPNGLSQAAS